MRKKSIKSVLIYNVITLTYPIFIDFLLFTTFFFMPLPIDTKLIYQLSCSVIGNTEFNLVFKNTDSPTTFQERRWYGKVWADLTNYKPFSVLNSDEPHSFNYSIERALQVIFTRFATREFTEGLFLLRAEMGQDWYTPILQQPHCTLRHMNHFLLKPDTSSSTPCSSPLLLEETIASRKRSNTICTSHPSHFETYSIFYLGHNVKEFCSAFYPIGLIPGINSWYIHFY